MFCCVFLFELWCARACCVVVYGFLLLFYVFYFGVVCSVLCVLCCFVCVLRCYVLVCDVFVLCRVVMCCVMLLVCVLRCAVV